MTGESADGRTAAPVDDDAERLTLAQAAQRLGIAPRTLERWAKAGRIPSHRTEAGERQFRLKDLLSCSTRIDDESEQP